MENVYDFPDRELIEKEAAEWLIRIDGDKPLDVSEIQHLREWMHRSPAHREELHSLSDFWGDQSLVSLPISLDRLCHEQSTAGMTEVKASWFRQHWWAAMAAVLVLAVFSSLMSNTYWLKGGAVSTGIGNGIYATAIGQQSTLNLPDGSTLFLNTDSQVKVDYSGQYRNLQLLRGEAHFEVAKEANRPFRVYAGRGRVQALGTAFNVYFRDDEDVDVWVKEGTVALGMLDEKSQANEHQVQPGSLAGMANEESEQLSTGDNSMNPVDELGLLKGGQETTLLVAQDSTEDKQSRLSVIKNISQEELERRSAWRTGVLVFSGHSLEEVIREFSRYTTVSIEIVDPEIKSVRVGGRFSVSNIDSFFNSLEASFGLQITRLDYNSVKISSREKASKQQNNMR